MAMDPAWMQASSVAGIHAHAPSMSVVAGAIPRLAAAGG